MRACVHVGLLAPASVAPASLALTSLALSLAPLRKRGMDSASVFARFHDVSKFSTLRDYQIATYFGYEQAKEKARREKKPEPPPPPPEAIGHAEEFIR